MNEQRDHLKLEHGRGLPGKGRAARQWSEEEVLERAYEEHLTSEQLFAYRDDPEAEPLRTLVETHVAGCPYCQDHLEVVCLLPEPEPSPIRLPDKVGETNQEPGNEPADAAVPPQCNSKNP